MEQTPNTIEIERLRAAASDAVLLLKALAHQDRLLLLCKLAHEERCVSDLEAELDIHQPTLSQQLGVLRREGLVETRREGKQIYYRIASPAAMQVIDTLYQLFCAKAETSC